MEHDGHHMQLLLLVMLPIARIVAQACCQDPHPAHTSRISRLLTAFFSAAALHLSLRRQGE